MLIHALSPEGEHGIVGKVNVTNVVRGRLESAGIGYDAYDPYAGRNLFVEGLRLILDLAFAPESAGGMGLHRVSAAVQPGNARSAGLLRALGFQREGFSPRMLRLPGNDGGNEGGDTWRDHLLFGMLADEWPAEPYALRRARRVVVLVNGMAGHRRSALAHKLAAELGIPVFSEDVLTGESLWAVLADSPIGGLVEGSFSAADAQHVIGGLRASGLDPAKVSQVWCPTAQVTEPTPTLGPVVAVDLRHDVGPDDVVRLALQAERDSGS
jgi:ribosomal-protein-alanine N-acetyltransferase